MTTATELSPALAAILRGPGRRLVVQPDGKLRCSLTGHVMPPNESVVLAHVNGAKYTRRAADADECEQLASSEPSLSKSKNFEGKWYCSLTCHVINATPSALRKHLGGKKIAFAKALVAKGEHEPVPEPDLEEGGGEDEEEEEEEEGEGMEASEEEQEEEEAGGSGRAESEAGAAAAKDKGTKKQQKKKKASVSPPPPPPKTPEESKGKDAQRAHDTSRPSRPKRARK